MKLILNSLLPVKKSFLKQRVQLSGKISQAKMFNFLCASSDQLLHYLDVHLGDKSIDTAIIHIKIKINYLLPNSRRSVMENVISNIVSGLVYTTTVNVSLLERVHVLILHFCRKRCFVYFDNRNTINDSLYNDTPNLTDKMKASLANNYIVYRSLLYI